MELKITRITDEVITCEIVNGGSVIDIARRWFPEKLQTGDVLDIDLGEKKDATLQ